MGTKQVSNDIYLAEKHVVHNFRDYVTQARFRQNVLQKSYEPIYVAYSERPITLHIQGIPRFYATIF